MEKFYSSMESFYFSMEILPDLWYNDSENKAEGNA